MPKCTGPPWPTWSLRTTFWKKTLLLLADTHADSESSSAKATKHAAAANMFMTRHSLVDAAMIEAEISGNPPKSPLWCHKRPRVQPKRLGIMASN